jgi:dTDP-4-dehydrorhamnose reductase
MLPSPPDFAPLLAKDFRILMTGITSIHGWPLWQALVRILPPQQLRGIRPPSMRLPLADNVAPLCITDKDAIARFCADFNPTHVIHCAGVCDLDVCEERPQWAYRLNTLGSAVMAELFGPTAHLIFLSTDLVFSGDNPPEQGYAEHHPPSPLSVAGSTFLAAEHHVQGCPLMTIVRLGLPVGASITGDKGGHDWIQSRFKKQRAVTLFYDEYRSCISCHRIADMVLRLLDSRLQGLFHYGGLRSASLYELGLWVLNKGGFSPSLFRGIYRSEEQNGPPRIGDVSMNCAKIIAALGPAICEQSPLI